MSASREILGPPLEKVIEVLETTARETLLKDPRILHVAEDRQSLKGGDRFVIRAHTGPLLPLQRKGLKGRINNIPVAYTSEPIPSTQIDPTILK